MINDRSKYRLHLIFFSSIKKIFCFCFVLNLFTVNYSQTLDEWKASLSSASSGYGPESIPYNDLRNQAKSRQDLVQDVCKTNNWSCDGLETKSLREEINGRSYKIEEIKRLGDKLNENKYNAQTDNEKREIQNKIDENSKSLENESKELDFKKKSLETDLSDIAIRIERGSKCLEARKSVQEIFKNAIDRAKNENDPEVKKIADQLIEYWLKRKAEHQQEFDNTNAGIEKCQKCKNGDL